MCDELKEGTVNYYHYLKAMELSERLQAELIEITGIFEPYNLFRGIPVVPDETLTNEIYIGVS